MFMLAKLLLLALAAYLAVGSLCAVAFVAWGAQAIDPAAKAMPIAVRLLILPGAAVLWPLLAFKWLRRQAPPLA